MTDTPARTWRAACPNCGAPVDFQSAASASAVCSFCRSTLVREGEALRRIGESAEVFDDHSPLQLGTTGRWQGQGFTLIGRQQWGSEDGPWSEWHALFDNGRSGWLAEDNGRHVFSFDLPTPDLPARVALLTPGTRITVGGSAWTVASAVEAKLLAAQGELPRAPVPPGQAQRILDLRNERNEVATLQAPVEPGLSRRALGPGAPPPPPPPPPPPGAPTAAPAAAAAPLWSIGRPVALAELQLKGLREQAPEKKIGARSIECPSCGTSLAIKLSSTQSISCSQCKHVVDLSQGIGPAMAHYSQENALPPQLPLGARGKLALGGPLQHWQIVGYAERCELAAPGSGDSQDVWREYLLYHPTDGFAFLVDTNEGWSWARTITGVPSRAGSGVRWQGRNYQRRWEYDSQITYVLGEFYWRVERLQRCHHIDFLGSTPQGPLTLSFERTKNEQTWSEGGDLATAAVTNAFAIPADQRAALARGRRPVTAGLGGSGLSLGWIPLVILILVVVLLVAMCTRDECADEKHLWGAQSIEYAQCKQRVTSGSSRYSGGGGSWGGYSSGGGGHK